jgi:hypothetical protein
MQPNRHTCTSANSTVVAVLQVRPIPSLFPEPTRLMNEYDCKRGCIAVRTGSKVGKRWEFFGMAGHERSKI